MVFCMITDSKSEQKSKGALNISANWPVHTHTHTDTQRHRLYSFLALSHCLRNLDLATTPA